MTEPAAPARPRPLPTTAGVTRRQRQARLDRRRLGVLSLAALGVVYGDLGTSPLYAMRECFHGAHAIAPTPANVLGVLSLILWSLVVVISIKYLVFVMRADNDGEGGILALMALARPPGARGTRTTGVLVALGLFGAALLYGDGMITPAISVLSAVEGLDVVTPALRPFIVPLTVIVLVFLFALQSRGTAAVGNVFGPVMLVWFVTIGLLGLRAVVGEPGALAAVNPAHAVWFFASNGAHGFLVLGSVFLVLTGGEALYADMGHFGKRPIRLAWFGLVLPSLVIHYFGQGALLLSSPEAASKPFYRLSPEWALLPLVALATLATVIASQAVISGAFSLTMQAVQLGYSPRVDIHHTSAHEIGQIYIAQVNWVLMLATIALVLGFESSSRLASAYGVAVTTTMAVTTLLLAVVARRRWSWPLGVVVLMTTVFLSIDLAFLGANVLKIAHGGWFPLAVAALGYLLMSTWKRGRSILGDRLREKGEPFEAFLDRVRQQQPVRVPGTAVFMVGTHFGTPTTLLTNITHNKVLHGQVVLLTVLTEEVPHVPERGRFEVAGLGLGFYRVIARYGFMEDPDVPTLLVAIGASACGIDIADVTYFLGRESLISTRRPGMARWRERLFAFMSRNAVPATAFFKLPAARVVELGVQIEL